MQNSGNTNKKQLQTDKEGEKATNRGKIEALESFNQKVKTYITHNKGASWELIQAPESDMRGKPTGCY